MILIAVIIFGVIALLGIVYFFIKRAAENEINLKRTEETLKSVEETKKKQNKWSNDSIDAVSDWMRKYTRD